MGAPGPMPDEDEDDGQRDYVFDSREDQAVGEAKQAQEAAETSRRALVDALLEERRAHPERAEGIDRELERLRG
jgi:hypothetical protein